MKKIFSLTKKQIRACFKYATKHAIVAFVGALAKKITAFVINNYEKAAA